MARRKTSQFDPLARDLADFAKAMSHPARITIVKLLQDSDGAFCGQIVNALPLAQPTISQHLRELERVGIITATPQGPRICYRLNRSRIRNFCHAFSETLGTANEKQQARAKARA